MSVWWVSLRPPWSLTPRLRAKVFPLITSIGAITRTYLYQGWRIRVGFLDGIAVREEYWKVTAPGRSATIADYEATAILDAEKGTGIWQPKGTKLSVNVPKMLIDHLVQSFLEPLGYAAMEPLRPRGT